MPLVIADHEVPLIAAEAALQGGCQPDPAAFTHVPHVTSPPGGTGHRDFLTFSRDVDTYSYAGVPEADAQMPIAGISGYPMTG